MHLKKLMAAWYEVGAATYEFIVFGQTAIPIGEQGCVIYCWF